MTQKYRTIAEALYGRGLLDSALTSSKPKLDAQTRSLTELLYGAPVPPQSPRGALASLLARQSEHDEIVSRLAGLEKARGVVRAALRTHERPEEIKPPFGKPRIPDVTVHCWDGTVVVYEVETAEGLEDAQTREQCKVFADYASRMSAVFFVLVVPPDVVEMAKQKLWAWNIMAPVRTI